MKSILKSIGWLILFLIIQIIIPSVFLIPDIKNGADDNTLETIMSERLFLTTIISSLLFVSVSIAIYKLRKLNIKDEWKMNNVNYKKYILPCIITFSYSLFYALITYTPYTNSTSDIHKSVENYGIFGIPLMILVLLVCNPITEEILNRAIIINTLKRSFNTNIAIIGSALIFGVLHFNAGGIILALGGFFIGLIFSIIYEKTNSLFVVIISHSVANIPDFILYSSPQIKNNLRIILAILALIISIILILIWLKRERIESSQ